MTSPTTGAAGSLVYAAVSVLPSNGWEVPDCPLGSCCYLDGGTSPQPPPGTGDNRISFAYPENGNLVVMVIGPDDESESSTSGWDVGGTVTASASDAGVIDPISLSAIIPADMNTVPPSELWKPER